MKKWIGKICDKTISPLSQGQSLWICMYTGWQVTNVRENIFPYYWSFTALRSLCCNVLYPVVCALISFWVILVQLKVTSLVAVFKVNYSPILNRSVAVIICLFVFPPSIKHKAHRKSKRCLIFFSKPKIKLHLRVFCRSCCCYGNLSSHRNDNNVFTSDWEAFWYHDYSIKW